MMGHLALRLRGLDAECLTFPHIMHSMVAIFSSVLFFIVAVLLVSLHHGGVGGGAWGRA